MKNKYIRTGSLNLAKFSGESDVPEIEVKKALVATVGTFKSNDGSSHTFTEDRLNQIAESTNRALDSGYPIPVCVDHNKTFDSTVGNIEGRAYTKVITPEDLPSPKASDLLGRVGLFFDDVVIKASNAVEKVRKGIVTSVSMGLNLDPTDHRIIELSLVPIPAINHMGLFAFESNFSSPDEMTDVYTWEDLESNQQSLDELEEGFNQLGKDLWLILNNIYNSNAIDISDLPTLLQYVQSALNGYSVRVIDLLGLTEVVNQMNQQADASAISADDQQAMANTQYQDLTSTSQYSNPVSSNSSKYTRSKVANFSNSKVHKTVNKYMTRGRRYNA